MTVIRKWRSPEDLAFFACLGGVVATVIAVLSGQNSDLGNVFVLVGLFGLVLGTALFLGLMVIIAWRAMYDVGLRAHRAAARAEERSQANPQAAYETAVLRRRALDEALFGTAPLTEIGRRNVLRYPSRYVVSSGVAIAGCLAILLVLGARQWLLEGPIQRYQQSAPCGLSEALSQGSDCRWSGPALVRTHDTQFGSIVSFYGTAYHLSLQLPQGTILPADLGFQDIPQAIPGSIVTAEVWEGKVTRVAGFGSQVLSADNPVQARADTWIWFVSVSILTLLLGGGALYRYWFGLSKL